MTSGKIFDDPLNEYRSPPVKDAPVPLPLPQDHAYGVMLKVGRPPDKTDGGDILPEPGFVYVDGRSPLVVWTAKDRAWFHRLVQSAAYFGLIVQEHAGVRDGKTPRRRLSPFRIDLDDVLEQIRVSPGILFDDWAKLYLGPEAEGPTTLEAARQKARVALHRLYKDDKIEKRQDNKTGQLRLFPAGFAPPGKYAPAPPREGIAPLNTLYPKEKYCEKSNEP